MKLRFFLVVFLLFNGHTSCQNLLIEYQIIDTNKTLEEVYPLYDTIFQTIINDFLEVEKKCYYFLDTNNAISLKILPIREDGIIQKGEYKLELSMWNRNMLLLLHCIAYFEYNNYLILLDCIEGIPNELFARTSIKRTFDFTYFYDGVIDDSHSICDYWYFDKKFFYGKKTLCM